ncbi:hypothetical protein P280DRAFT_513849 [Massarina eburnea CBS 473.64]|uniref:Probable double zinc ribbon domain-containing protein n=1 Tax=Massarina eburnea CBS 473.64 TaxID=1395130 RepID=A0A6A6SDL3_9PLEO|nr:hypothetical protein P280DRAFT_513849 [Massarina eburnea CBS 473.64]
MTREQLEARIRSRPHVQTKSPEQLTYSPEFPNLNTVMQNDVDGAWLCYGCGHENPLVHREGEHPFGYLDCGRCGSIFSGKDEPTQVLGHHVLEGAELTPVPSFASDNPVPYGIICPRCGLSHRGQRVAGPSFDKGLIGVSFSGIRCHCGTLSHTSWYRFSVGPSHDWRGDQIRALRRATTRRLERRTRELRVNTDASQPDFMDARE